MIRPPVIGAAGLTDATSKVGEASWGCAHAAHMVSATSPAPFIPDLISWISSVYSTRFDEQVRATFRG
jgi:hypothetical protein